MKDSKTLKIVSIIVAVLIAVFCITKILAAGMVYEDGEEWVSTEWGHYIATEDGELLYSEESYVNCEYEMEVIRENDIKDILEEKRILL